MATPPTGVSGWIAGGPGRVEERKGEIFPIGQQHGRWMVTMRGPNGLTRGGERPPETVVEGGVGASMRDRERKLPEGRSEASVMGLMGRHNGCFYNGWFYCRSGDAALRRTHLGYPVESYSSLKYQVKPTRCRGNVFNKILR